MSKKILSLLLSFLTVFLFATWASATEPPEITVALSGADFTRGTFHAVSDDSLVVQDSAVSRISPNNERGEWGDWLSSSELPAGWLDGYVWTPDVYLFPDGMRGPYCRQWNDFGHLKCRCERSFDFEFTSVARISYIYIYMGK